MGARRGIFALQCKRARRSGAWRRALLVFMAVLAAGFAQTCLHFWGHDVAELPAASFAWTGNHGAMQTPIFGLFVYFLMIPCSTAIFSDRFFRDVRQKQANALITRSSIVRYVVSTALIAFLAAFLTVFLALLFSQVLAFLVFPAHAGQDAFAEFNTPASYEMARAPGAESYLLAGLMGKDRYGYNLLIAVYEALWSGILALSSFAISLYTRRSRLLILGAPTLLLLTLSSFLPSKVNVMGTYLGLSFMWGSRGTILGLVGLPFITAAVACGAIMFALATKRDVLL